MARNTIVNFVAVALAFVLLVFFFTPDKYLGLGGWGIGLLVLFSFQVYVQPHPFREGLTWVSGLGGGVCLISWAIRRSNHPSSDETTET